MKFLQMDASRQWCFAVRTDRYKLQTFQLCFHQPLNSANATSGALMAQYLNDCLEKQLSAHPIRYKAHLGKSTTSHLLRIAFQIPSSTYLELGDDLFHMMVKAIRTSIDDLKAGLSMKQQMGLQKRVLQLLKWSAQDQQAHAVRQCLQMLEGQAMHNFVGLYGDAQELEHIDWEASARIWQECQVMLLGVGDFTSSDWVAQAKQHLNVEMRIERKSVTSHRQRRNDRVQVLDGSASGQVGMLVMGYGWMESLSPISVALMQSVLGSGGHSLLFQRVRDQEQLVYDIRCQADVDQRILLILAKVKGEHMAQVEELVRLELARLKSGELDETTWRAAVQAVELYEANVQDDPLIMTKKVLHQLLEGRGLEVEAVHEHLLEQVIGGFTAMKLGAIVRL